MATFGRRSKGRLSTCHPLLQLLLERVVRDYDCTILTGHRGKREQERAFRDGKSKVHFPGGKHNALPSNAADVAPFPIDWNNTKRFYHFAAYVQGVASVLGIKIRWGGDWDRDFDLDDQNFNDLVHFEIIE